MILIKRALFIALPVVLVSPPRAAAQTVVFRQNGFPAIESSEVPAAALASALGGKTTYANVRELADGECVEGARLLVLPYGSAFPVDAWPAMLRYLQGGGNLLLLGGQPLRVPVTAGADGGFAAEAPQDSYSKLIDLRHSYAVPFGDGASHFRWRQGYGFLPTLEVKVAKVFAEEGRLNGLGYLDGEDGTHLAAPVIVSDHNWGEMAGSRIVALPFTPEPGYWASKDGISLIRAAALYAQAGATSLQIEAKYSMLRPGEPPELKVHLYRPKHDGSYGTVDVTMLEGERVLDHAAIKLSAADTEMAIPFHKPMQAGVYTVRATWSPTGEHGLREFTENGFEVEDLSALEAGDAFGVNGDFLSLGGKPFLPVGTNYFTTEENGWDFSGPRNAAVWEHDFADMQRHGVNFVRTGVWMSAAKFTDPATGAANERFLRNLEAYLAAAHRHNIVVNFTFFAFTPRMTETRTAETHHPEADAAGPPPPNPYLDPATLALEKGYVASVAKRFGKLPWLSYDLINEPSFSNPRVIFHGNVPNGDPAELAAWHGWLQTRYGKLALLAEAWRTTEGQLGDWSAIPLPQQKDLNFERYGDDQQVRAIDYNLFAQEMFQAGCEAWSRPYMTLEASS